MHFRGRYLVHGFVIQGNVGGRLQAVYPKPRSIQVALMQPQTAGLKDTRGETLVESTCTVEPKPHITSALVAIAERRIPEIVPPDRLPAWDRWLDETGRIRENQIIPSNILDPGSQAFLSQLRGDLFHAARECVFLLRWRYDLGGSHSPLRSYLVGAAFSIDGESWHPFPTTTDLRVEFDTSIYPFEREAAELQRLIDEDAVPPLADNLFREAWDIRGSNRRGALLVGVAALEVAVKAFIGTRVPESKWLVDKLPSPPIIQILRDYLPKLPLPSSVAGPALPPPEGILKLLEHAVTARNGVAHASGKEPTYDRLEEMLSGIRDVLWLLDYYNGHGWALAHVREETRVALPLALPADTY
jgi:hypothetical protein